MNDTLVGILGLAAITATVISLIRSRMLPAMAFILWPSLLALVMVADGRCGFADIEAMIRAGFDITAPIPTLFVFSVLFFGIMTEAGMFNVLIKKLMTLIGDNVVGVAMVTAIISLAGHLDGSGAATFCIVIPAMFPVYIRMHMRKTTLLRIAILPMGIMNLLPWGVFPSYFPFMLGTGIALFANYGSTIAMHKKIITRHASPALLICSTMMGAAVLMGLLTSSIGADGKVLPASMIELPHTCFRQSVLSVYQ